jgi:hypothetical protein
MSWQDELREKIAGATDEDWEITIWHTLDGQEHAQRSLPFSVEIGEADARKLAHAIHRSNDREFAGMPAECLKIESFRRDERGTELHLRLRGKPWNSGFPRDNLPYPPADFDLIPSRRRAGLL